MHYSVPQLTLAVSSPSFPNQMHETALLLFIMHIHHCQYGADAQMLRYPQWARCSNAVLLDFLMRVRPQIHPCLQSPWTSAWFTVCGSRAPHSAWEHCRLPQQPCHLPGAGQLTWSNWWHPNLVYTSHSARGTNSVDHGRYCWRWPQWWTTQWTILLWSVQFFSWLNTIWSGHYAICYLLTRMVFTKSR